MMDKQVIPWGRSLRGKQRKVWRDIERRAFRDDLNYFPNIASSTGEVEKEFFVLSVDGDYVGRASATINKSSIAPEEEESGFIEDFVILEPYQGDADLLISCCLSSLRERGARQVIARGGEMLPAIQTEGYEQTPPFGCPHNPPWYADVFLRQGFLKTDEWTFFNYKLPQIPPSGGGEFEQTLSRGGIKLRPLNIKNRREFMEFEHFRRETNPYAARFSPIMSQNASHFRVLAEHILSRLFKAKVFIGVDKGGRMVFFTGYMPDFNLAIKRSHINPSRKRNIYPLLKLPFIIRRTKVCREIGMGLAEEMRGKGYMKNLHCFAYLMRKGGYEEVNAGVQTTNLPMQHLLQNIITRYGDITPIGKYATLAYNF